MAVTAKFLADFTSFNAAVASAETKLRGFETGATRVESALARMGDSFSGRRILQEATLAAKAVEDIGGVSKLTETEQRRLNATLTEAMAKYKALGQVAPRELIEMESATRRVGGEMQTASSKTATWKTQLQGLAGAFGVAFSVGAVVNFGRELLRMGDEIVKVGDRTGLTTKEVQQLSYVATQSGNSIDEITSAIGQMQNRLVSGDQSAVAAVRQLGINLKELMAASPATQMGMIADAMAKVQDPALRAALAMDVFGKTGLGILPTLTSNFSDLAAAAPVMSDATVKALDTAGDALARLGLHIKVWAAESYNFAGQVFDEMVAGSYRAVAAFLEMTAKVIESASKFDWMRRAMKAFGVDLGAVKTEAQWYRDAAAGMTRETIATTAAVQKLAPAMYAGAEGVKATATALARAEKQAAAFAAAIDERSFGVRRLAQTFGNVPAVIQPTNDALREFDLIASHGVDALRDHATATAAASAELVQLGMILPALAVESNRASESIQAQAGALAGLRSVAADLPKTIMAALTGGGDVGKAVGGSIFGSLFDAEGGLVKSLTSKLSGALGSTVGGALGSILPGIGTLLGAQAGKLIGPLMEKAWAGIKKLGSAIGGLFGGPDEQEKQGRSAAAAFREELAGMLTDVQKLEAGNEGWAKSVIVVRDAYLAAGRSEQDALDVMDRLWRAEKQGGDAVARVIAEITAITKDGLTPALTNALTGAADGFRDATDAGQIMRDELGQPIVIPVRFDVMPMGAFGTLGSDGGGGGYLTPDEADAAGVAWRPKSDFNWSDSAYRDVRTEDQTELNKQAEESGMSFASGTGGKFLDFGAGTAAMLHGRERVMTEAEGEAESSAWSGVQGELAAIRSLLRDQPRQIGLAMQTALLYGGVVR